MTPWVARLLYANALAFLVSAVFPAVVPRFAFVPALVLVRPWTLITYAFLHGGLMHLAFNMLMLFFFGSRLELRLGGRRFLTLYLLSAAGGAALSFLFAPHAAVIGASGAVYGISIAFAHFWPRDLIYIWGIVPIQARVLVLALTVLSVWFGFGGAADGVAHFAHLGGFVAGYGYVRWVGRQKTPARSARPLATTRPPSDEVRVKAWEAIQRDSLHDLNREELDRILEKLRDVGPTHLTTDERDFLDRFATG
jgi:membrane associated rhomboid family serine protease